MVRKRARQESETATSSAADGYFKVYEEYAKTLRTWFVAFGVGAPVLLFTSERVATKIASAPASLSIALTFFVGAGAQVVVALINKVTMWALYYGEIAPMFKATSRYRLASRIADLFVIDFLGDAVSVATFGWATLRAILIVVSSA